MGLQWCAITAVCLGSLLLLLALVGTAGARLRNRFSLLGFAALEAAVSLGLLLSGTWCLALAGSSATLSEFTWEAMNNEARLACSVLGVGHGDSVGMLVFLRPSDGRPARPAGVCVVCCWFQSIECTHVGRCTSV